MLKRRQISQLDEISGSINEALPTTEPSDGHPLRGCWARGAESVMKLVEPTGRGRGWHENHRTGSRSRVHAWVWGIKLPEAKNFTKLHML